MAGRSGSEPVKPRNLPPAWNGLREHRECRAVGQSAKAMSASKFWNISMSDSPGSERTACQEGVCSESPEPLVGRLGYSATIKGAACATIKVAKQKVADQA